MGNADSLLDVFPAGAGMNRELNRAMMQERGVPRRRGDEPAGVALRTRGEVCSPQARG